MLSLMLVTGFSLAPLSAQKNDLPNGWKVFAKVKFEPEFQEKEQHYLLVPKFDEEIKQLEGKQVKLKGFVMPFDYGDEPVIVLSKYPFSSCYFCGGAGPESVAEIFFENEALGFGTDEKITVIGTLRLNVEDINHMNFILENSELIEE